MNAEMASGCILLPGKRGQEQLLVIGTQKAFHGAIKSILDGEHYGQLSQKSIHIYNMLIQKENTHI